MGMNKTSSIKFGPSMYKVFRNIPNTAWNALCEFIDNSIQAILDSGSNGSHDIVIDISNTSITVTDYGPGFSDDDLSSGLEPARIPENRSQLNEFGMGMKLAALYFGDRYSIQTSTGNSVKSLLCFDLDEVVNRELTEIPIKQEPYTGESFTSITIEKLSSQTRINVDLELEQIKQQISQVYSVFISEGRFRIIINGFVLSVPEISILNAPWWKEPDGKNKTWIEHFEIKNGQFGISGYVALRDPMSSANRGFKLVRRGRVVDGIKSNVKPHILFGTAGSHLSKRLTGQIILHGFGISFNKSELLNTAELDALWKRLKEHLNSKEYSILSQGKEYRLPKKERTVKGGNTNPIPGPSSMPIAQPVANEPKNAIEIFNLKIGSCEVNVHKGVNVGKFIQGEHPKIILRSDFFNLPVTRKKVLDILQTFELNTDATLDEVTIIKLIDLLWPVLK